MRGMIAIPRPRESELAVAFSKTAGEDLAAAMVLHERGLYPQAVYSLQQSVEKTAKALGLLMGTIKINQIRQVSHRSVFALLTRTGTLSRSVKRGVDTIGALSQQGGIVSEILSLGPLFKKVSPLVPTEAALTADREAIRKLDPRRMWLATLNLDEKDEVVAGTLAQLKNIHWDKASSRGPLFALRQVYEMIGGDDPLVDYALDGVRSYPRAIALSMLTMWHEEATRYPPVSRLDYWDADAYTKEKALVKKFPMIADHAGVFNEGIHKKAVAGKKLSSRAH